MASKQSTENKIRNIRRKTKKQYSTEEKIRIVIEGLRGDMTVASYVERKAYRRACITARAKSSWKQG